MPTDTSPVSQPLSSHARRRQAVRIISGGVLVATVVVVAYFVLPLTSTLTVGGTLELLAGVAVIAGVLAWQIRAVLRSPLPGAQAVAAIAMAVPSFLVLFATSYYVMGDADPKSFSEQLTKLDSLYFTITTFATVGFGDITSVSQAARAVTTVQMVLGLILVGLVARVIFGAVQVAIGRQHRTPAKQDHADE